MVKNSPDHPVNEVLPFGKLLIFGLQHVLAMYIGAITVPIVVGNALNMASDQIVFLISADLFVCGIATIVQTIGFWRFGIKIPILQGVTFTCLSPIIAIGLGVESAGGSPEQAIVLVLTSVMISGLFTIVAAPLIGKGIRLFPPIVTGSIILIIGLSLLSVGINMIGGQNFSPHGEKFGDPGFLLVGFSVIVAILIGNRFLKGFLQAISVMIGIVVGLIVSIPLGYIDFSSMMEADWFRLDLPLGLNMPWHADGSYFETFSSGVFLAHVIPASLTMIIVMIIVMIESAGSYITTGEIIDLDVGEEHITDGLRADGLGTFLGGFFNTFCYTAFVQNIGLVALTRVRSRFVVACSGCILVILGMIPKLAAFFDALPAPVIGGAALVMFAIVAGTGVKMLSKAELDTRPNNLFIIAISLAVGMTPRLAADIFSHAPSVLEPLIGSGVTLTAVTAIILNIFFNGMPKAVKLGTTKAPEVAAAASEAKEEE